MDRKTTTFGTNKWLQKQHLLEHWLGPPNSTDSETLGMGLNNLF